MAAVPKGFLRYHVLKLLSERPMSGSELMNEIENRTHRHWKPSPGSIYPLLSWLQDKGYSKEVQGQEPGIKRYELTDEGKTFLEEHIKRGREIRKKRAFFFPPFMGPHMFAHRTGRAGELIEASRKLVTSTWNLLDLLPEKGSEEAVTEVATILERAASEIEDVAEKLKPSDDES
jgi:DNA-binding PadR family transcriptional regulator